MNARSAAMVCVFLCSANGLAGTDFESPVVSRMEGHDFLDSKLLRVDGDLMVYDCGFQAGTGYTCTFNTKTGEISQTIPISEQVLNHIMLEKATRRFPGASEITTVRWAPFPCNARVVTTVTREKEYLYRYSLEIKEPRGLSVVVLTVDAFTGVLEPAGKKIEPRGFRRNKTLADDEMGYVFYPQKTTKRFDSELVKHDSVVVGYLDEMKNGHRVLMFQPGRRYEFALGSKFPPGGIEARSYCLPDFSREHDPSKSFPSATNTAENVVGAFFDQCMTALVPGPRRDLADLEPAARAEKLVEELNRYEAARWVNQTVAEEIRKSLLELRNAATSKSRIAELAESLIDVVSGYPEEQCSVECRSILTIHLELIIRDARNAGAK